MNANTKFKVVFERLFAFLPIIVLSFLIILLAQFHDRKISGVDGYFTDLTFPFKGRVLVPTISYIIDSFLPGSFKRYVTQSCYANTDYYAPILWFLKVRPELLTFGIITAIIDFLSLITGFLLFKFLIKTIFPSQITFEALAIYIYSAVIIVLRSDTPWFYYDHTSLLFSLILIILLLKKEAVMIYAAFFLACLNKETFLFFIPILIQNNYSKNVKKILFFCSIWGFTRLLSGQWKSQSWEGVIWWKQTAYIPPYIEGFIDQGWFWLIAVVWIYLIIRATASLQFNGILISLIFYVLGFIIGGFYGETRVFLEFAPFIAIGLLATFNEALKFLYSKHLNFDLFSTISEIKIFLFSVALVYTLSLSYSRYKFFVEGQPEKKVTYFGDNSPLPNNVASFLINWNGVPCSQMSEKGLVINNFYMPITGKFQIAVDCNDRYLVRVKNKFNTISYIVNSDEINCSGSTIREVPYQGPKISTIIVEPVGGNDKVGFCGIRAL